MALHDRFADWLETHWVNPAYAGWVLGGLSFFFLAAAANTLAGWLYVISGISLGLLLVAGVLPARTLRSLSVRRLPIEPISAGDSFTMELEIANSTPQAKTLLVVRDLLPASLGKPVEVALEFIPAESTHRWVYYLPVDRRGVYRWTEVQIKTAAPFGLFWCRRSREAKATAIAYPQVLPLRYCPFIDELGKEDRGQYALRDRRSKAATEGITRTLRPYTIGDPIRLVHWRTSARYGDLRVRELETFTSGQEAIVALDSASIWDLEHFEQAVIAAASLYFYASHRQMQVSLWTAATGMVRGHRQVLETLAATQAGEEMQKGAPPQNSLIWLTQRVTSIGELPSGSRWLLWLASDSTNDIQLGASTSGARTDRGGTCVRGDRPLEQQLQAPIVCFFDE